MLDKYQNRITALLIGLFVILSAFILFPHSGSVPMQTWDEARVVENAIDMYNGGDLLVTHYDGKPDHWNAKPPLLVWLQVLSAKIFSPSEFAFRFPTLLAFLIMGIGLILLFRRLGHILAGFFTGILCLCVNSLFEYHCFRSADYDGMLICWMMLCLTSFFVYLKTNEKKYYILFFIFLLLGLMTKDVQMLIPLPTLLIYLIVTKRFKREILNPLTWIGTLSVIFVFFSYVFIRDIRDNGYLMAIIENDFVGRYSSAHESNSAKFLYYFDNLKDYRCLYFFATAIVAFGINIFTKEKHYKSLSIYFGITILCYFLVISSSATKLFWYAYPLLPMFVLIVALCLEKFINYLYFSMPKKEFFVIAICFVLGYSLLYSRQMSNSFRPYYNKDICAAAILMKKYSEGKLNYNKVIYLIEDDGYRQDYVFYYDLMTFRHKDYQLKSLKDLHRGDIVQSNTMQYLDSINHYYDVAILQQEHGAHILMINSKKQNSIVVE